MTSFEEHVFTKRMHGDILSISEEDIVQFRATTRRRQWTLGILWILSALYYLLFFAGSLSMQSALWPFVLLVAGVPMYVLAQKMAHTTLLSEHDERTQREVSELCSASTQAETLRANLFAQQRPLRSMHLFG